MRKSVLALLVFALGGAAYAASVGAPWLLDYLWQEEQMWDGLNPARHPSSRQQADPQVVPVTKAIAKQVDQQLSNMEQINAYTKNQQDNVRLAATQRDPQRSLMTIGNNLETLAQGADQVHGNLLYLSARCRMLASQALPDPELTASTEDMIHRVQNVQLKFNDLYTNTTSLDNQLTGLGGRDRFLKYQDQSYLRSVTFVQDSIYSIYNSCYEVYNRSK